MDKIETVRIESTDPETQGPYVIVNKDDFDKKTMKVYDGPDNPEPVKADAPKSFEEMAAKFAAMEAELAALKGTPPAEGADGWGKPPAE
jgi:hypothetical protein